ncbi:MAG TPA: amino acid permease [Thermoprotei archaeon]|nr:APC family permease [TACK group archaeon]HEV50968.1 amino acid permease [Thermoprotei archaeon]
MAKSQEISVAQATAVSLGAIIGAGIFVLSGTVLSLDGAYSFLSFIYMGFVSLVMAFELGELTSLFPETKGSSYSFAYEAFGSQMGFVTGVLMYFSYATSISAIALGFGSYLVRLIGFGNPVSFAILLIAALTVVNMVGVKKAAETDFYLVAVKVAVLVIFIAFALFISTRIPNIYSHFEVPKDPINGFFQSSGAIIFAYSGFQSVATIASDVKGGGKGAAKAIVYSVVISMVLYIAVALSMVIMAPTDSYAISADPLSVALSFARAPQFMMLVVDLGALLATTSATLATILTSSRTLYQMGADGLLPRITAKYDQKRDVASTGVLISSMIGVITLFAGNVYVIVAISNFGLLFSYLMTTLAVIHFRRKGMVASFRTPLYPYLTIATFGALLTVFFGMPKEALIIGVITTLVLIMAYSLIREAKREVPEKVRLFERRNGKA